MYSLRIIQSRNGNLSCFISQKHSKYQQQALYCIQTAQPMKCIFTVAVKLFGNNDQFISFLQQKYFAVYVMYCESLDDRNILIMTSSNGSSDRVGGSRSEKHEIYATAFGGHIFYDLSLQGTGGRGHGPWAP